MESISRGDEGGSIEGQTNPNFHQDFSRANSESEKCGRDELPFFRKKLSGGTAIGAESG
jgi:hypothetical protein